MVIRAGGENWIVEDRDAEPGPAHSDHPFMEVRFRPERRAGDEVAMRWIPRPDHLTPQMARRLFVLAGERRWEDRRSGTRYEVHLLDDGTDDHGEADGILIRFRWSGGEGSTRYAPRRPLGMLPRQELERLVDEARSPAMLHA